MFPPSLSERGAVETTLLAQLLKSPRFKSRMEEDCGEEDDPPTHLPTVPYEVRAGYDRTRQGRDLSYVLK